MLSAQGLDIGDLTVEEVNDNYSPSDVGIRQNHINEISGGSYLNPAIVLVISLLHSFLYYYNTSNRMIYLHHRAIIIRAPILKNGAVNFFT